MITHTLDQGTPEWHAHRKQYHNASDAPAMMGASLYKTRNDLLKEAFLGYAPDVEPGTQKRFDEGHRIEALARPVAEEIIGEELYPVVGTEGKLGASFDGLTMNEAFGFEHKTLNDTIRKAKTVADLHPMYLIQMEQQLMVSGALKILFLATRWEKDVLIEQVHFWYSPDIELRALIIEGWKQFEIDLANYLPRDLPPKPQAAAIMRLPALSIQITGQVSLSNLPEFKEAADQFVASIKTDLDTDEDFANAEANVKFLKDAEANLEKAKTAALNQTADIDLLMRTIDKIQDDMKAKRLSLDRLVKEKKEAIKTLIVVEAKSKLAKHIQELNQEIAPVTLKPLGDDFAGVIKNKRTLVSLHDAVDTELARVKMLADSQATKIRNNLVRATSLLADYGNSLVPDLETLAHQEFGTLEIIIKNRIDEFNKAKAKAAEPFTPLVSAEPTPSSIPKPITRPSRAALVDLVSSRYTVAAARAEQWLVEIFSAQGDF